LDGRGDRQRAFVEELPRLLAERELTLRALAEQVGVHPSHLSRVLRQVGYKTPGPELARKVAVALDLPDDYFPEYREGFVIERIQQDARVRERLYDEMRAKRGAR
jgi:transcriptional regulator with XRE-family HTH domain